MGDTPAEPHIPPSLYFIRPTSFAVLIFASLLVTCFLVFGNSTLLVTVSILFLSTIFIIVAFSKEKVTDIVDHSAEGEETLIHRSPKSIIETEAVEKLNPEVESILNAARLGSTAINPEVGVTVPVIQCETSQPISDRVCQFMHEYQVEPTDFPSGSDSSTDDGFSESEDFELSWRCPKGVGQSIAASESSISDYDEDGLIEISLPQNNSVFSSEESNKKTEESNLPAGFLPESVLGGQQDLMELFAEVNEVNEENLIEIDLSVGSIKGSTFEIEA